MKSLIALLFVFFVFNLAAQVPNGNFESWTVDSNGIEYPEGWVTNNYPSNVSAEIAPVALEGNYSLRLSSNAPGIEGPVHGICWNTFSLTGNFNLLTATVLVDSVEDGYVGIRLLEFTGGTFHELLNWQLDEVTDGPIALEIPFSLITGDSLRLELVAANSSGPILTFGYAAMIIDDIQLHFATSTGTLDSKTDCFKIYPNPASGVMQISKGSNCSDNTAAYSIFDLHGRLLFTGEITSDLSDISIDLLPAGTYLLVFEYDGGLVSRKVVIE